MVNFVRLTEHKSVLVKERFFPLIFTELVRARLFKRAGGILLVRTKFFVVFFPTCGHNAQKYKMYGILVINVVSSSSLYVPDPRFSPTTRFNLALNQRGEQDKTNRLSYLYNRFPETGSYKKSGINILSENKTRKITTESFYSKNA